MNYSLSPNAALPQPESAFVSPQPSVTVQTFHNILHQMFNAGEKVSDLIFSPGRPPQVEISGDLQGVPVPGLEKLSAPQIKEMADLM